MLKDFKEHAVAYAQEHLGNNIMDELKKSGRAIGKAALTTSVSKLGSIKDVGSAKVAARDVGMSVLSEGKSQLAGLANKYFGGAGTPEQAVKVCAYTVSELRKIITHMRRKLSGLSVEDWLDIHAHRANKPGDVDTYKQRLYAKPSQGGFSMKTKRQHISQLKKLLHPPVSKMDRRRCVEYIFGTARELDIDWEQFFEGATERKRIPKGCYKMTGPGQSKASDDHVLAYPKKTASKRAPSAYNLYMKEMLADRSFFPNMPYGGVSGRFARAARKWKAYQQTQAATADRQEKTATFQKAHNKKIPKKRRRAPPPDDSDEELSTAQQRAQFVSMGLPTQFR